MMTFKSFTSAQELFELLVDRFRIQPPPELTAKELETWAKLKQHVIQMRCGISLHLLNQNLMYVGRVLNIFKSMVLDDDILDKEDFFILERIKEFALSDEVSHFAAAKQLLLHVERAVSDFRGSYRQDR